MVTLPGGQMAVLVGMSSASTQQARPRASRLTRPPTPNAARRKQMRAARSSSRVTTIGAPCSGGGAVGGAQGGALGRSRRDGVAAVDARVDRREVVEVVEDGASWAAELGGVVAAGPL